MPTLSTGPPSPAAEQSPPEPPIWGLHLQPSGAIFVDRMSLYYARLTGPAYELALQLARTGSLRATSRIQSRLRRRPAETLEGELAAALAAHPLTASWLDGELTAPLRVTGSTDAYLPLNISLQLTNACNLHCSFCYAGSGRAYPGELKADEWVKVIERLATASVAAITLTGGEPTAVPGFPRILSAASALVESVDVFTNGLSFSDEAVAFTAALGNVSCQVSIDGAAESHDALRGRAGSYRAALSTIRRLSQADVRVVVAMTVSPTNHAEVATVLREVAEAGARGFRAGAVMPIARGAAPGFALSARQIAEVNRQFAAARDTADQLDAVGWDQCGGLDDELAELGLPVEFRTPGYLSWHVMPTGRVTPCQVERESFGDIMREPLTEIGGPQRLAGIRSRAGACACIGAIDLPDEADLPFGLRPGSSCCRGGESAA
jgi:sporulation killing factor system radical SAM maturase